ncbi:MAG: T9SS type A sorting domain-containing protein [candidate division Zixibacteria bacterium]|nr:T9SS type A sorting domain-containing protein [candidate division Zixibacteria bacterium]
MFNLNRGMFFTILVIAAALFISSISLAQFVSAKTISLNDALSEINISIVNDTTFACHGEGNAMFDAAAQNIPCSNFTLGEYDSYEISAGGDTTGYNPAVPTLCFNICVPTTFIDQINAGIPLLDRIRLNSTLVPLENPTGKLIRPSQDFPTLTSRDPAEYNYGPARLADPEYYQQLNNFPELSASVVHVSVLRNIGIIGFEIPLVQYNGAEWFRLNSASLDIPIYDIQNVPPIDKKKLYHGNHNGSNTQDTCYITWMSERFPFFEADLSNLFINPHDYDRYKQPICLVIPPDLDDIYLSLWIIPDLSYQSYGNHLSELLTKLGIPNMFLTMDQLQNTAPEWDRLQDKLKSLIYSMHGNSGLVDLNIVDGSHWDESRIYQQLFLTNTSSGPGEPGWDNYYLILGNSTYYGDVTIPIPGWDLDDDGAYGEMSDDRWDIGAEIQVGNIPARNPEEFGIYIDNLEDYMLNGPGVSELNARVFCHDQMADDNQENKVFDFLPRNKFAMIDTLSGVEPDGNADPTTGPTASNQVDHMWFWTKIAFWFNLSHGNGDSWTACTDDYNHADRSMVCSNQADFDWWETYWPGTGAGTISDLAGTDFYSILYSTSCWGADYDLDWQAMCSRLLFQPNGGTIANVGNTRWGWTLGSYRQGRIFFDELFNNSNGGWFGCRSLNRAKLRCPYHSDHYNTNWMGYAGLRIWTDIPNRFAIDSPPSMSGDTVWFDEVVISANGGPPPSDVIVCVWMGTGEDFSWKYGVATPDGHIEDLNGNEFFFVPVQTDEPAPYTDAVQVWVSAVHSVQHNFLPLRYSINYENQHHSQPKAATDTNLPDKFAMHPAYPNPFNAETIIKYDLPQDCQVSIQVYDLLGREVANLVDEFKSAGYHQVVFNAAEYSSGMYFYRIKADKFNKTLRMALIK